MGKKNYKIEFVRIIGCYIVIATHVFLPYVNDDSIDYSRLFIRGFLIDGVPLFLVCTGFYYFNTKSLKKRVISTFYHVIIPALFVIFLCQILWQYITGGYKAGTLSSIDWNELCEAFLEQRAIMRGCPHLWYIFTYISFIIWYPVLALINDNRKVKRYIIGLSLLAFAIDDIFRIIPVDVTFKPYIIVDGYLAWILIGSEVKIFCDRIKCWQQVHVMSLFIYLASNIGRFLMTIVAIKIKKDVNYNGFNTYLSIIGVISGIALFIFVYTIEINNEKCIKIINYIGSKSFLIFLIHYPVKIKMESLGIYRLHSEGRDGLAEELLYNLSYAFIIFFICFITVVVVQAFSCLLHKYSCIFFRKILKY